MSEKNPLEASCVFNQEDMRMALMVELEAAGLDHTKFAVEDLTNDAMEDCADEVELAMNNAGFAVIRKVAKQWAQACLSEAHYEGLNG